MYQREKAMKKIESLRIYGRRWFQRSYGNTYHTVRVIVNGEEFKSDITYGYEVIKPLRRLKIAIRPQAFSPPGLRLEK